jgi:hypothetical protein
MAPHCEELTGYRATIGGHSFGGIWKEVADTKHFTGDNTGNAKKSHKLATEDPFKYREVADDAGVVCSGFVITELFEKL